MPSDNASNARSSPREVATRLYPESPPWKDISVLRCSKPTAYSWHNGEIFLTSGLLELLPDDAELAAAIAHEVGHLQSSPGSGVLGLSGREDGLAAEIAADAAGVEVLNRAGVPGRAMASMLAKVRDDARIDTGHRAQINVRVRRLEEVDQDQIPYFLRRR